MAAQDPRGCEVRALIAGFALLVLGCASGPFSRGPFARGERADRQAEVERRLVELEKEATKARLEIERLRRRLAELETAPRPAPRPAASPPVRPAPPPPPAATLVAPPPIAIEESELEEPADSSAPTSPGEAGAYEHALELLRTGRAVEAESALASFVAAHPASDLADNAWFWIGEARLVRQQVPEALAAYRTAVETYPEGNKTPDALFKIAHCLALQGEPAMAAEVWAELVRRFPGTAAAERAREALAPR